MFIWFVNNWKKSFFYFSFHVDAAFESFLKVFPSACLVSLDASLKMETYFKAFVEQDLREKNDRSGIFPYLLSNQEPIL